MKKDAIKIGILAVASAAGVVTKSIVQISLTKAYKNRWLLTKKA